MLVGIISVMVIYLDSVFDLGTNDTSRKCQQVCVHMLVAMQSSQFVTTVDIGVENYFSICKQR